MNEPTPDIADRAIFHSEGDTLVPSTLARGPWYHGSQHGSAMLGLLARAVERHPSTQPMQVARLTIDLTRAAPMAPLTTPTRTIHAGKSVELVEATIESGGKTFARASAMRFRIEEIDVSDATPPSGTGKPFLLPPAGTGVTLPGLDGGEFEAFHRALEICPPVGTEAPAMWFRLRCPFVAGEAMSPVVRTAAVADWTYSLPFLRTLLIDPEAARRERSFTTINPDTSLNLHRPMVGEWLCMESQVHHGGYGAGSAVALIHDAEGPIGHASQSLLIRGADKRPVVHEEMRRKQASGGA